MPQFDLPLEQLIRYRPPILRPRDFDAFWRKTLADTPEPIATFSPLRDPIYKNVAVFDVRFNGFAGDPISGWMLLPQPEVAARGKSRGLPCIVTFVGYGGGRGYPLDHVAPCTAGFAHFVMDTRGQGSGWSVGATSDPHATGPQHPGFMTRGIESPETYYYRRVFVDAVCAVRVAAGHPDVDAKRVMVSGASQGGGIAIVAAALAPRAAVRLLCADVPFLCHFRRATTLVDSAPSHEIVKYLAVHRSDSAAVFRTLSYFDGANFAPRVRCRSLFSVALMDQICPPSTVYAAFNRLGSSLREMRIYDFNQHEGGGALQAIERLRFAKRFL